MNAVDISISMSCMAVSRNSSFHFHLYDNFNFSLSLLTMCNVILKNFYIYHVKIVTLYSLWQLTAWTVTDCNADRLCQNSKAEFISSTVNIVLIDKRYIFVEKFGPTSLSDNLHNYVLCIVLYWLSTQLHNIRDRTHINKSR